MGKIFRSRKKGCLKEKYLPKECLIPLFFLFFGAGSGSVRCEQPPGPNPRPFFWLDRASLMLLASEGKCFPAAISVTCCEAPIELMDLNHQQFVYSSSGRRGNSGWKGGAGAFNSRPENRPTSVGINNLRFGCKNVLPKTLFLPCSIYFHSSRASPCASKICGAFSRGGTGVGGKRGVRQPFSGVPIFPS